MYTYQEVMTNVRNYVTIYRVTIVDQDSQTAGPCTSIWPSAFDSDHLLADGETSFVVLCHVVQSSDFTIIQLIINERTDGQAIQSDNATNVFNELTDGQASQSDISTNQLTLSKNELADKKSGKRGIIIKNTNNFLLFLPSMMITEPSGH